MEEHEIITMQDDEGGVFQLQVLDRITLREKNYIVVQELIDEESEEIDEEDNIPAEDADLYESEEVDDDDEDDGGVMIYRLQDDGGFEPIEDEEELDDVFDMFRVAWDDYEFCDAQ